MSSKASESEKPGKKSSLSDTVFQSLRNFGKDVCTLCQGADCRDCSWFGTEEARESYDRAKQIVGEIRQRHIKTCGQVVLNG